MTKKDSAQARCFCICAAGCLASPSRQRTKKANAKKNKREREAPVCVIFFQSFQPPLGCTIDTKHQDQHQCKRDKLIPSMPQVMLQQSSIQPNSLLSQYGLQQQLQQSSNHSNSLFLQCCFFACFLFLHYDFVCACQLLFTHRTFAISTGASP